MRGTLRCFLFFLIDFLIFTGWVAGVKAQMTVNIRPSQDNTLYEDNAGSLSNGIGQHMFAGRTASGAIRRAVVRFPVIEFVPPNALIQSVQLTLNLSKTSAGPVTVSLHRLLKPWGEGNSDAPAEEGQGTQAQPGDATWMHTFFDTSFWNTPGGDFVAQPSAQTTVGTVVNPLNPVTWGSTAPMIADVQFWLAHPDSNFGWIVVGDESTMATAKRFDTKDNPDTTTHPLLTITYTMPVGIADIDEPGLRDFELVQNYPNPFNPSTTIEYRLNRATEVSLKIFNVLGQEIRTLVQARQTAGTYRVVWDGRDARGQRMPGGVYFYRLKTDRSSVVKKMILLP
ncbi:MAG: DNRLRE domain-containing protein [Calditrichaeota bacterium]|nr:MAG: DNRLRE domain-containing protein [Calditrichota bacterium]